MIYYRRADGPMRYAMQFVQGVDARGAPIRRVQQVQGYRKNGAVLSPSILPNPSCVPRTDSPQSGESGRDEGGQIFDPSGLGTENQDGNSAARGILPMPDALVHGQDVEFQVGHRQGCRRSFSRTTPVLALFGIRAR